MKPTKSLRLSVRGVVQGVGFRPFIYRLAHEHKLAGWVRNTSGSVEIEIEGKGPAIDRFIAEIKNSAPTMSRIEEITLFTIPHRGYSDFQILESHAEPGRYQLVSPDIATCEACRQEIFSPDNRRYRYPFTNCTNCGPRFTIIEDIPYDRPLTTMRHFKMCPDCQKEYDDPLDRRFHAQPNACPVCGPSLRLVDAVGRSMESQDIIRSAADLLRSGGILAIKGLGGFLLACDSTNSQAVRTLRERKHRPSKPFAVMMASLDDIREHCLVTPEEATLLESPQCPIVLLRWKREESSVCAETAPNLRYLGVMLPYTPLHHLLMREVNFPLVMTSGNLSEEPIAKDNDESLRRLNSIADYFLLHNRDIYAKYDDSVCIVESNDVRILRRARGYAPYPITLPFESRQILACGAEEKNTFCLTRDRHAFVSQHIGEMENEETLEHFETTIELYKRLFRIEPEVVAYDLHPEYLSTKYALELKARGDGDRRFVAVQHHHAHIASCLVENNLQQPVIGVAFDGTGYGPDGTIWGGEFMVADLKSFRRVGHIQYIPMPGGAIAIKKPYRMALGYIYSLLGEDLSLEKLPLLGQIHPEEVAVVKRQLERRINSPLTSSAGRLFDAVSALAGVRGEVDYDAQAAIELEMIADNSPGQTASMDYPLPIVEDGGCLVVQLRDLLARVIEDVEQGLPASVISTRFHRSMARMIAEMCLIISRDTGIKAVALSGGVFQNRFLFSLTGNELRAEGFEVISHRLVPCNDGGISLGQAVIANFAVS